MIWSWHFIINVIHIPFSAYKHYLSSLLTWSPNPTVSTMVSCKSTLLSCRLYVLGRKCTPFWKWLASSFSNDVLKSVFIKVDLPIPVSPVETKQSLATVLIFKCQLCRVLKALLPYLRRECWSWILGSLICWPADQEDCQNRHDRWERESSSLHTEKLQHQESLTWRTRKTLIVSWWIIATRVFVKMTL